MHINTVTPPKYFCTFKQEQVTSQLKLFLSWRSVSPRSSCPPCFEQVLNDWFASSYLIQIMKKNQLYEKGSTVSSPRLLLYLSFNMSMSIYITGILTYFCCTEKKKKRKKSLTFWQTYIAILYNSFYFIINIIFIIIVPFILDNDRSNIDQWTLIKELTNFQSHMWQKNEIKTGKEHKCQQTEGRSWKLVHRSQFSLVYWLGYERKRLRWGRAGQQRMGMTRRCRLGGGGAWGARRWHVWRVQGAIVGGAGGFACPWVVQQS